MSRDKNKRVVEVRSPMVGTFYDGSTHSPVVPASQSDTGKPYVKVGSPVEPDTIVGIIETMAVGNEIKAGVYGTIEEKLIKSGQPVRYEEVLFKIRPDIKKGKIKVNSLENKTRQIEPILNPNGADKQTTDELIEALSTVPKSSIAYNDAQRLIRAVKKGYEIQSGEKYRRK